MQQVLNTPSQSLAAYSSPATDMDEQRAVPSVWSCPADHACRARHLLRSASGIRANDTFASDHFDSNLESDQVARYTTGDTLTILTLFGAPTRIPTLHLVNYAELHGFRSKYYELHEKRQHELEKTDYT